jgi:hypothetical protein
MSTQDEDKYVYLKMQNGENIMATKVFENNEIITIESPMLIRMFPRLEPTGLVEQITSGPYCQFTEERTFTFQKKDVLFTKRLHTMMIPHYERMISEQEGIDEPELAGDDTVENISKAVDHLHSIFEKAKQRKEQKQEVEEEPFTFVLGNDTMH